jgi:hypothetical protein
MLERLELEALRLGTKASQREQKNLVSVHERGEKREASTLLPATANAREPDIET